MSRIASCKIALTESGFCRPAGRAPLFPRGRELPGALDRLAPNHYNGFVVLCSGGAVPPELFFCPGAGAARLSLLTGLVVGAGSILLYQAFAPWIIRIFISDAQTVSLATSFIRIRILGTPLMFLSFFTVYLFQGFGKGGISLILAILRWAVFNIPMICLLNYLVGMYGIIWSPIVGDTLTVLVSIYAYCTQKPVLEAWRPLGGAHFCAQSRGRNPCGCGSLLLQRASWRPCKK